MIANVKITFLICLTFIISTILFLSYSEYNHRYELITTQNNGIYIFDKKTTILNKCENGKCETIQTNFPNVRILDRFSTPTPVQAIPQNITPAQGTAHTNASNAAIAQFGVNTVSVPQNPTMRTAPVSTSQLATTSTTSNVSNPQFNSDGLPTLQSSLVSPIVA